jgi:predicted RNA-binding Zn ribbon-like protein
MAPTTKQVPPSLDTVREFVNTRDIDEGTDRLSDPDALRDWLAEQGLLERDAHVAARDLARARKVREAIRALLLANTEGDEPEPRAIAALNAAASRAELSVRFHDDGSAHLEPAAHGVPGALGRLLAIVYGSRQDGSWSRLKACRNDTCRWAFYDLSKNRSRHWCSMAVCGSRSKARTYRRRRAERRFDNPPHGAGPSDLLRNDLLRKASLDDALRAAPPASRAS